MTTLSPNGAGTEAPLPTLDNDLFDEIEQLTPRMLSQVEKLDEYREQLLAAHRQQLDEVDQRKRKLIALLKQMGVEVERPKSKRKGSQLKVGLNTLIGVIEAILGKGDDEYFTALGLHEEQGWGWSEPHTYVAFQHLKGIEFIRRDRKLESGRWQFAILDRHVGEKLLEESHASRLPDSTTRRPKASTERMELVKNALRELTADTGEPVTVAQIAEQAKINTTSVRDALRILTDMGAVLRGPDLRGASGHFAKTYLVPEMAPEMTHA